jgi:hypothetical protein
VYIHSYYRANRIAGFDARKAVNFQVQGEKSAYKERKKAGMLEIGGERRYAEPLQV